MNESNKCRFIKILQNKFEEASFTLKQTLEDADILIDCQYSHSKIINFNSVIIVGVLVLLTAVGFDRNAIFFLKPRKGRVTQPIY